MHWFLLRSLSILLACGIGGVLGRVFIEERGALIGLLAGGFAAAFALVLIDSVRGSRLLRWLAGTRAGEAARTPGLWGETAYRVERAMRSLERQVEDERRRLTEFVAAIEASPNGVMLLDGRDRIEWCNAQSADHFGLDPTRDRRQPVTNLIRAPAFVGLLQSGQWADPVTFLQPRGLGSIQVLIRRYGAESKLVLSQDLTERERSEAMRRDFVANVSHEIRTPLTVLAGFLETMRNLPLSEAERTHVVTLMSQQAHRMAQLVNDLLTIAQLEGSPRPAPDQWVSLAALFGRVEAEGRALSAGRHAMGFADAGAVEIAGSEAELHSAVANLVGNAVRYTPEGGRIDVGWRVRADGSGVVSVSDTGRGIAREHLARLTERFYRVDAGRSRETGGTGLGLAIVKHVAQRHGGELEVESELNAGSTFCLVLPPARVRRRPEVAEAGTASQSVVDPRP
jgi:two-component system phosphate regulon sensor histidine kinase PhoR